MKNPKLSLCMIVKNEEKTLGNCLKSAASFVDEMIVVDTGSTDSTIAIAEEFGAKVFKETWQDDFSQARNVSLEKATGDWILVLDADEEVGSDGIEEIKPLLNDAQYNAYLVQVLNCSVDEKNPVNFMAHQNVKLFRNHRDYFYRGIIHEELNFLSDAADSELGDAPFKIFHYGYHDDSAEEQKTRRRRNTKLLNKALEQDPNNPKLRYHIGDSYLGQHKWQKALNNFELARAVEKNSYLQPLISRDIIMCFIELGRLKEALAEVASAHEKYPDFLDIHYLQGEIYAKMKQYKKALDCFRDCVSLSDKPSTYCEETGIANSALFGIGMCGMILSHDELAVEAFTECMKVDPADAVSFEYLGQLLLKQRSPAKAAEQLAGLADIANPAIMEVLLKLGLKAGS